MAFPQTFLDELVTRNDFVDVVSSYVALTKKAWILSRMSSPDAFTRRSTRLRIFSSLTSSGSVMMRYSMMEEADFPNGSENTQSSRTFDMVMEFIRGQGHPSGSRQGVPAGEKMPVPTI